MRRDEERDRGGKGGRDRGGRKREKGIRKSRRKILCKQLQFMLKDLTLQTRHTLFGLGLQYHDIDRVAVETFHKHVTMLRVGKN